MPADAKARSNASLQWVGWAALVTLAAVLFVPWFKRGRLLGYDWVSGPYDRLPTSLFGTTEGRASVAPVVIARRLLAAVMFGRDPLVFLLTAGVVTAAWGYRRLLGRERVAAWVAASAMTSVNVFVYQRASAASFGMVLGLLLLPAVVAVGREALFEGGLWRCAALAVLITLDVAALPQFAVIAPVAVAAFAIAALWRRGPTSWAIAGRAVIASGTAAVLLGLYWLVPALDGGLPEYKRIGAADLAVYATRGATTAGRIWNVVTLGGMWRSAPSPLAKVGVPLLGFAVLMATAVVGAVTARGSHRRLAVAAIVVATLGGVISLGASGPTGGLFRWAVAHAPAARAFREPAKAEALMVLGYSILVGEGVGWLSERGRERSAVTGGVMAISVALIAAPGAAWGPGGLRPVRPPSSWSAARAVMEREPGTTLALPWHLFLSYPFTGDHAVQNPTPYFFPGDVVSSSDPQVPHGEGPTSGTRQGLVTFTISQAPHLHRVGSVLSALGIRWVLLEHSSDSGTYGWIDRQSDVRQVGAWAGLVLYRVTEPAYTAYAPGSAYRVDDWGQLLGLAESGIDLGDALVTVDHPAPGPVRVPLPLARPEPAVGLAVRQRPDRSVLTTPPPRGRPVVFTRPYESRWVSPAGVSADLGAITALTQGGRAIDARHRTASEAADAISIGAAVLAVMILVWASAASGLRRRRYRRRRSGARAPVPVPVPARVRG